MRLSTKYFWETVFSVVPLTLAFLVRIVSAGIPLTSFGEITVYTEFLLIALALTLGSILEFFEVHSRGIIRLMRDFPETLVFLVLGLVVYLLGFLVSVSYTQENHPLAWGLLVAVLGVTGNFAVRQYLRLAYETRLDNM